jgi:hypothetical protein
MRAKCQPGDIAIDGHLKISRVVKIRTLLPIAAALRQEGGYFGLVRSSFLQNDRVSFVRYNNDAHDEVIEILPLAIVNVLGNGDLQFFPRSEIEKVGEPEFGWKLAQQDKLWVVRYDGRTVQRYPDRQHAEWWLEEQTTLQHARAS